MSPSQTQWARLRAKLPRHPRRRCASAAHFAWTERMKCLLCKTYGPIADLRVEDVAVPSPGPGQVLIDVHAASLNFPDALMVQGTYQVKPPLAVRAGKRVRRHRQRNGRRGDAPEARGPCGGAQSGWIRRVCACRRETRHAHTVAARFRNGRRVLSDLLHVAACAQGLCPDDSRRDLAGPGRIGRRGRGRRRDRQGDGRARHCGGLVAGEARPVQAPGRR